MKLPDATVRIPERMGREKQVERLSDVVDLVVPYLALLGVEDVVDERCLRIHASKESGTRDLTFGLNEIDQSSVSPRSTVRS